MPVSIQLFTAVQALATFARRIVAGFDMCCRIADAQRLLNLVFDGAGDLMSALDIPSRGQHDMEIDPMESAAVAMAKLVIAAYPRLFSSVTGIHMVVQNAPQVQRSRLLPAFS